MNYFAHAYAHLGRETVDPYFVAGAAVPDWLCVASRRTKCRTRHVEPWFQASDPRLASLARGVAQHHADDAWFHETRAFSELSLDFAKRIRLEFDQADGLRPWFLGHILVELLLDDTLIQRSPSGLDRYYSALGQVDKDLVSGAVERMTHRTAGKLAWFIERFLEIKFLADYGDDDRLLFRLNQVMQRVNLSQLPREFAALLPAMRADVTDQVEDLLRDRPQTMDGLAT